MSLLVFSWGWDLANADQTSISPPTNSHLWPHKQWVLNLHQFSNWSDFNRQSLLSFLWNKANQSVIVREQDESWRNTAKARKQILMSGERNMLKSPLRNFISRSWTLVMSGGAKSSSLTMPCPCPKVEKEEDNYSWLLIKVMSISSHPPHNSMTLLLQVLYVQWFVMAGLAVPIIVKCAKQRLLLDQI